MPLKFRRSRPRRTTTIPRRPDTTACSTRNWRSIPLLHDPAIDRALDNPPYRARRILFSWTAYAIGLGRPAWILKAYAIQNVVVWLLLAWLLCRWMPPSTPRAFVLWAGCLLSPGLLSSVRYALPDGPCALLIATRVMALPSACLVIASRRPVGLAGLGRETSLFAATLLGTFARRGLARLAAPRRRGGHLRGAARALGGLPAIDLLRSGVHESGPDYGPVVRPGLEAESGQDGPRPRTFRDLRPRVGAGRAWRFLPKGGWCGSLAGKAASAPRTAGNRHGPLSERPTWSLGW